MPKTSDEILNETREALAFHEGEAVRLRKILASVEAPPATLPAMAPLPFPFPSLPWPPPAPPPPTIWPPKGPFWVGDVPPFLGSAVVIAGPVERKFLRVDCGSPTAGFAAQDLGGAAHGSFMLGIGGDMRYGGS
jgi:hypothetical protein